MSAFEERTNSHREAGRPAETRIGTSRRDKFLAWLASLATVSVVLVNLFLPQGDHSYLRGLGVAVLVLASVFIFVPFFILRKHGRIKDGETYMQTSAVVDQGPYAITRHPQYLGYMFFGCGFALLSQQWIAILFAAVAVSLFYLHAVEEEKTCLAHLGDPYEQYRQRVPRFNIALGVIRLLRGGRK